MFLGVSIGFIAQQITTPLRRYVRLAQNIMA
jgi:hypothetical protein